MINIVDLAQFRQIQAIWLKNNQFGSIFAVERIL